MSTISRRQFLASLAACGLAGAVPSLILPSSVWAASPRLLRAESRVIDVAGRAAKVFGLVAEDGRQGLALQAGKDFRVRLENALDAPTLIHWHGLLPPFGQDGVPDLPQPLLKAGEGFDYAFPLDTPGTHWMHAHTLQEQQLLAAPLIVSDPADASLDEQEVVVLLHDFSFKSPEELLEGLAGGSMSGHGMAAMGGHGGHGASGASGGMAMDINDIEYDAYLANDRTLDDPEVFRVEQGGSVRLRIINGATATASGSTRGTSWARPSPWTETGTSRCAAAASRSAWGSGSTSVCVCLPRREHGQCLPCAKARCNEPASSSQRRAAR